MKHLFTLMMLMCLGYTAQGQWWFDAGIKGSWGPTGMSDQNVYDDANYKHKISTGTSFGGRVGINTGYHVGLSLEYAGANSNQEFEYNGDVFNSFQWKHSDISTLIRYSGNGAYIEGGAKFSNIKEVELDNVTNGISDVSENFVDSYTSVVFGFGSYLLGTELLTLNLGVRGCWAFDDMVSETGKENNYPIVVEDLKDPTVKTHAASVQLQLELNYAFGRFSKEACHDRWKLILFQ